MTQTEINQILLKENAELKAIVNSLIDVRAERMKAYGWRRKEVESHISNFMKDNIRKVIESNDLLTDRSKKELLDKDYFKKPEDE